MASHHQYLWEHAVLLSRNYESKASAELFSMLSTCLKSTQDRQRCIVNHGLLRARLGDIIGARNILHEAFELEVPSIIVRCALAEVEAIAGNIRQARYWYESCLKLCSTNVRADEAYHFGYCPSKDVLTANIRALATSTGIKDDLANSAIGYERIPADALFIPAVLNSHKDSAPSTKSTGRPRLPHATNAPVLRSHMLSTSTGGRHTDGELSTLLEDVELDNKSEKEPSELSSSRSNSTTRQHLTMDRGPPIRRRQKLEARGATTQSESLRELSDFIRNAGPAGNQQYLVDHKYLTSLLSKVGMDTADQPSAHMSFYDALLEDFTEDQA